MNLHKFTSRLRDESREEMLMKKIWHTFVLTVLLLALTACGKSATDRWQEQYDLGEKYLLEEDYEAAIVAFTAAIEIDPNEAAAYIGRGDAYILFDGTEENLALALADYEKVLSMDETYVEAYLGIVEVYSRQGEYEAAETLLQQGLQATDNDSGIQERLEKLWDEINSVEGEAEAESDSVEEADDIVQVEYWIGICQLVQHELLDAATQGFEDALLAQLGGKVEFDYRNADGDTSACYEIASALVAENVDLIMAVSSHDLRGAMAATSDIPIIATCVTDYSIILGHL